MILKWIEELNQPIAACNNFPLHIYCLRNDSRGDTYKNLSDLIDNVAQWLYDKFNNAWGKREDGSYETTCIEEVVYLPSIWEFLEGYKYLKIDETHYLEIAYIPHECNWGQYLSTNILRFIGPDIESEYNKLGLGQCKIVDVLGLCVCILDCFISQIHNIDDFNLWIQELQKDDFHVGGVAVVKFSGTIEALGQIPRVIEMKNIFDMYQFDDQAPINYKPPIVKWIVEIDDKNILRLRINN